MQVKAFNGLNNVADPIALGLSWLKTADNINVTPAGGITRRSGYSLAQAGNFPSGYATVDEQRLYLVEDLQLKTIYGTVLAALTSTAPMWWTEVEGVVFFNNGTDSGLIQPDNTVLPWAWPVPGTPTLSAISGNLAPGLYRVRCTYLLPDGRETGPGDVAELRLEAGHALQIADIPQVAGLRTTVYLAPANSTVFLFADTPLGASLLWRYPPEVLGMELNNVDAFPLPAGSSLVQEWRGRIFVAMYDAEGDQTVLWQSQALGYHLFNVASDYLLLPGKVLMLAPHAQGLVIGTERAIHAFDGTNLVRLADYGVVPGQHWDFEGDGAAARLLFWSTRGLCAALPFANLTEGHVSVAPGASAGGAVLRMRGASRYFVALQKGGTAFNPWQLGA